MQNEQCKREYMESVKSVAVDEVLDSKSKRNEDNEKKSVAEVRMQDRECKREYRESAKSVALPENQTRELKMSRKAKKYTEFVKTTQKITKYRH